MSHDPLKYPIGPFQMDAPIDPSQHAGLIDLLAALPAQLRAAVHGLTEAHLDTPYREGGWTVRQVVHHIADSHANAYVRIRLALTEDRPVIKPYEEKAWALLPDSLTLPVEPSLQLVDGLHQRFVATLRSVSSDDFVSRGYQHPETKRFYSIERAVALYAWHGQHHVAHITSLRTRQGWT